MVSRSSRQEYDERVCLSSASDGEPKGVEYRLRVSRDSLHSESLFYEESQGANMKLVSVDRALLDIYSGDSEVLHKEGRPYVLILKLTYKGEKRDFAVPIRSNIPANAPKETFFALPPRPQTRKYNRHGLHYSKMFPVSKQYIHKYRIEGNAFAGLINSIIVKNMKTIVADCQRYLTEYEKGKQCKFSTNLDYLIERLSHSETCIGQRDGQSIQR